MLRNGLWVWVVVLGLTLCGTQPRANAPNTPPKGMAQALVSNLKGFNTQKMDERIRGYEATPVEEINPVVLPNELALFRSYSDRCRKNYRDFQLISRQFYAIETQGIIKGYAYILESYKLANDYKQKIADLEARKNEAFERKYGPHRTKDALNRWYREPLFQKFSDEESEIFDQYQKNLLEVKERYRKGFPETERYLNRVREEIKRQCLFISDAIYRLENLLALQQGKPAPPRPPPPGQDSVDTPPAEELTLKVLCDRSEIFEDELAYCRARLFMGEEPVDWGIAVGGWVSNVCSWRPDFVDVSKGALRGEDVSRHHTLPPEGLQVEIEAKYESHAVSAPLHAKITVLVKPRLPGTRSAVEITKTPSAAKVSTGDTVVYHYTVSNTGETPLEQVDVTDDQCSPIYLDPASDLQFDGRLDPGESWRLECSAVLKQDTSNIATVTALDPAGALLEERDFATVTVVSPPPGVCPAGHVSVPDLSGMTETEAHDALKADGLSALALQPVRNASVPAGQVAAQDPPAGDCAPNGSLVRFAVSAAPPPPSTPPPKPPGLAVVKTPSAAKVSTGDTVDYNYEVNNSGGVELTRVTLSDDTCSPVQLDPSSDQQHDGVLSPGETWRFSCSAVLNSDTTNTATATAEDSSGAKVSASASATVSVSPVAGCPPGKEEIPYLLYRTEQEARDAVRGGTLAVQVVRQEHSIYFQAGQIMTQDPVDGSCVDPHTLINLVVSSGPAPAPPPATPTPAALNAELDCGEAIELAAGDFMGKNCGVVVRGWRSNTEARVELWVAVDSGSGIEVTPGDTSAPPSLMYTAGVSDTHDRYVFTQSLKARQNAPEGVYTVTFRVRQEGAGEVTLRLRVAVLPQGQRPSGSPGIRPPAVVASGSGGPACVWRHHILYAPPECFEFVAASCRSTLYRSPRYELVGQGMTWAEADLRISQLSPFHGNAYDCRMQSPSEEEEEKPPEPTPTEPPAPEQAGTCDDPNAYWDKNLERCVCYSDHEPCGGICRPLCARSERRGSDCECRYDPNLELAEADPEACKSNADCETDEVCVNYLCIPQKDFEDGTEIVKQIREEEGTRTDQPQTGATGGGDPVSTGDYGESAQPTPTPEVSPPVQPTPSPVPNSSSGGTGGLTGVTVNQTPTTLLVWDHKDEDGDRVRIALNGQVLVSDLTVMHAPREITLKLNPGANTVEVTALNVGAPNPGINTAAVKVKGVIEGSQQQAWELKTGQRATMEITYTP